MQLSIFSRAAAAAAALWNKIFSLGPKFIFCMTQLENSSLAADVSYSASQAARQPV